MPYLRSALRSLRNHRAFALASCLCLALGLGANTAIFSVVNSALYLRLPYPDAEQVALIWSTNLSRGWNQQVTSPVDFGEWQTASRSFESMAAMRSARHNFSGGRSPLRIEAQHATTQFFEVLGVEPLIGRGFGPQDTAPGAPAVVVLSHQLWQSALGGDPAALGSEIRLDGRPAAVIGVMPADFWFADQDVALWRPLRIDSGPSQRGQRSLIVIGRLAEGRSLSQAQSELDAVCAGLEEAHPETNQGWAARAVSLPEALVENAAPALVLLFGAVSLVLLIACANVGNLFLARASARRREIAVRRTLGAGRLNIVRLLMTESLLIALGGGLTGLVAAYWGTEFLRGLIGQVSSELAAGMAIDLRVVGYLTAVTLAAPLIFGLAPAVQGSRIELVSALRNGRQSASSPRRRLRGMLVVAEIALSLVLLVAAGLMMRSLAALESIELGFDPRGVLTLQLSSDSDQRSDEAAPIFQRVVQRIEELPGVIVAGAASSVPTAGSRLNPTRAATIEGRGDEATAQPLARELAVVPGYIQALRIPLLAGRLLSQQDTAEAPDVALVSRTLAQRFWPDADPLGRRFKFGDADSTAPWIEVVGVVADVINDDRDQPSEALAYRPLPQSPRNSLYLVARTSSPEPLAMAEALQQQVWAEDPDQPVSNLRTMESILEDDVSGGWLILRIMGTMSMAALALAAVGVYGVMAYLTYCRRREVGIRMALGAGRGRILRQVAWQGMALCLLGLLLGLAGSAAVAQLMAGVLYGVPPFDPVTFSLSALLLLAAALLASSLPAWKAARSHPMSALRSQ